MIPDPVKLGFDPAKTTDAELRAVIDDEIAWLLWQCWRPNHMVSTDFNGRCVATAARIRARNPQTVEELVLCFRTFNDGDFTIGDVREFCPHFLPYLLGEKTLETIVPS